MKKVMFLIIIFCFFVLPLNVSAKQVLFQKNNGDEIILEIESSDTIEAVISKLLEKLNIDKDIELTYNGLKLEEGRTIADYNILAGDTIHFVVKEDLYVIEIIENLNGIITTDLAEAKEGEEITINIKPNSGYKVNDIIVYNIDDEKVILEVKDNKFTMPNYNVAIDVEFVEIVSNPATKDNILYNIYLSLLLGLGTIFFIKKKLLKKLQVIE